MDSTQQTDQQLAPLILVVDDNLEFLSGVELTLTMEGYHVWTATNGQEALYKLEAASPGKARGEDSPPRLPDLILADIMMPLMDGHNFYERVLANPHLNHIPFIFLTAKSSPEDIRQGKELGADDYLTKPFSPEDLLASIRGKLRRVEQQHTLSSKPAKAPPKSGGMVLLVLILAALIIALLGGLYLFL